MTIPSQIQGHFMRTVWRRLLYAALAVLVLVLGFLGWAYRATQQVPEFYVRQLELEAFQRRAGDALEKQALQLNSQIRKSERWQARFTAEDINGWLAVDLPQKFPRALPSDVQSPRVAIDPEMIQLACKVESPRFSSVVSLGLQPYVTSEPNVIALRVKQLAAGSLPLPLSQYMEQITAQCAKSGLPLRWTEEEGDPVALVTLPLEPKDFQDRQVRLEQIELAEGEIVLSGTSEPMPKP